MRYINLIRRNMIIIVLLITVLILTITIFKCYSKEDEIIETKVEEKKVDSKVKVDIKGRIKNSGVYEVNSDKRIIDVINMAGGLKDNANTKYLNLSKKVTDEMVIIIYSNEEIEKLVNNKKEVVYVEKKCDCPDNINNACMDSNTIVNGNKVSSNESVININTSDVNSLTTLSGVGESKAKAIIKYREENGEFKKIEDIMNVSGIGEKAFEAIKDYITI